EDSDDNDFVHQGYRQCADPHADFNIPVIKNRPSALRRLVFVNIQFGCELQIVDQFSVLLLGHFTQSGHLPSSSHSDKTCIALECQMNVDCILTHCAFENFTLYCLQYKHLLPSICLKTAVLIFSELKKQILYFCICF